MSRRMSRRTSRRTSRCTSGRDAGTTLVEVMVAAVVLGVVLVITGVAVTGMIRTAARLEATAASAQDARRAVDAFRRGLSSADLVNPPAGVGAVSYLEARAAAAAGMPATCRQWRVDTGQGLLQSRTWTAGTTTASGWVTLATGVVNTAEQPVFTVIPAGGDWATARVVLDLRLQRPAGGPVPAAATVALANGLDDSSVVVGEQVCGEVGRP